MTGGTRRSRRSSSDLPARAIFDESSDGVLVLDARGHRVYANPALNALVGTDACLPLGTPAPPPYVAPDQRAHYLLVLERVTQLLAGEVPGAASTWLELTAADRRRVCAKVTIGVLAGPRGVRNVVWLLKPDAVRTAPRPFAARPGGAVEAGSSDPTLAWTPFSGIGTLTPRERDVLQLLVDGRRVSSIARTLYLSPYTVRNHLKAIFQKLGAHSQVELLDALRPVSLDMRAPRPPAGGTRTERSDA
ncbi:MAG: LuxR C-terminal-related transcriptional regulator [Acidimicrobiales bacterium]